MFFVWKLDIVVKQPSACDIKLFHKLKIDLMHIKKEFWTLRNPRTEHANAIKLSGDMNNNKMERFNGEIRDREKTMSGLKIKDTPILTGIQIFHNYIRPHEGLEGKTPSEACGIKVEERASGLH
jgi:hypothetical protein